MPHSFGYRARTRHMFSRKFREHGMINLSTYMRPYSVGDYVDIVANGSIHKGMPHKFYHGRTGIVYNVSRRAIGVEVNKEVRNRIVKKRISVRVEHVRQSKCRADFLARVNKVDTIKREAKKAGKKVDIALIKRFPAAPRAGYVVDAVSAEGDKPVYVAPKPFDEML